MVMHRGKLIRSGVAAAAAVACAVAVSVPALAAAGRPAGHREPAPGGYGNIDTIQLGALPLSVAVDPRTDTTYVGEQGKGRVLRTAVLNDRTDKVVATLPVFGYNFAFDSRTGDFYLPTQGGVAIIAGQRLVKRVPVAADDVSVAAVDPRTGHVFVSVQNGTSSSIVVLSDRTNKVTGRIPLPASALVTPMAASPAHGLIYAGVTGLRHGPSVWVIGSRRARVLARIPVGVQLIAFAVDDRDNLLGALSQDTLTVVDGRTHQARAPVDVTNGTPEAGAQAEGFNPQTRTFYAAVECDPASWVTGVSERTGKVVATINTQGALRTLAVDTSRSVVFAVDYVGGDVLVINARTNTVITTLGVGVHPGAVAVNPVTGRAYVANSSRTLSVLGPAGTSARPASGPAGTTARAAGGQAVSSRRGTCG